MIVFQGLPGAPGDIHPVDPETQARLEALLEAAGMGSKLGESKQLTDPEVICLKRIRQPCIDTCTAGSFFVHIAIIYWLQRCRKTELFP